MLHENEIRVDIDANEFPWFAADFEDYVVEAIEEMADNVLCDRGAWDWPDECDRFRWELGPSLTDEYGPL